MKRRHRSGYTPKIRKSLITEAYNLSPKWCICIRAPKLKRKRLPLPPGTAGYMYNQDEFARRKAVQITSSTLKQTWHWLKRTVVNHRAFHREPAIFLLCLEFQPGPGNHFHIIADSKPGKEFIAALRKSWLKKVCAQPEEESYCWYSDRTKTTPEKLASYISKHHDQNGTEAKRSLKYLGALGEFTPYAVIGKRSRAANSQAGFHNTEAGFHNGQAPPQTENPATATAAQCPAPFTG